MSVIHWVILNHEDDSFIQRILISFPAICQPALDLGKEGGNKMVMAPAVRVGRKQAGCHDEGGERV